MDSTTICKFIICIGILQKSSFYHVDGILFEVPNMVEWSKAGETCQKNNAKLFKPNETFDVPLFSEWNFKADLWVEATFISVNSDSALLSFWGDSNHRCEMCTIVENCGTTCLYKPCGTLCGAVCEIQFGNRPRLLHVLQKNWTEAREWCWNKSSNFSDMIQNGSSLLCSRYYSGKCFWAKNVIQVNFQTVIAPSNDGKCGIIHNGKLSFTSCDRQLHPLCETESKTALETLNPYFSEGSTSSISMNTKIMSMSTTLASRRTNRIKATLDTSTYGTSHIINSITNSTSTGLNEENSSLLVPVGATASRSDVENSQHISDTGIIIGAVTGSFVFLMVTVLVIIFFRRRLLQRTGERKSKHSRKNTKMHTSDTIDPYQCQNVRFETGSGITVFAQLESNCEGSHTCNCGQISDPRKPVCFRDPEGSKCNYEALTRKDNVNSSDPNTNINYDGYDHLNLVKEGRDDQLTGNVYQNINFE